MKKIILASCITASAFLFSSCKHNVVVGHGEKSTDTRAVGPFSVVAVSTSLDITIDVNETAQPGLTLSGYKNILEYIKTDVSGDTLRIYTDKKTDFESDKDIVATISTKTLSGLSIAGSSDAEIAGDIKGNSFTLKVTGAGDVKIHTVHVNDLKASISGAGDLDINEGAVNNAEYHVTGAGDVEASNVVSQTCVASVSGAGDMRLNVQKRLDARVSGTGGITYQGNPEVTSKISGVGSINKAGE